MLSAKKTCSHGGFKVMCLCLCVCFVFCLSCHILDWRSYKSSTVPVTPKNVSAQSQHFMGGGGATEIFELFTLAVSNSVIRTTTVMTDAFSHIPTDSTGTKL